MAQLTLTMAYIGVIVGGLVSAWLLPRVGFRTTIVSSTVLLALCGAVGALLDNSVLFLAARFVVGLCSAAAYSALLSLSATLFKGVALGRVLAYQNGISAIPSTGLILLSGWLASRLGWRYSLLLYATVLVLSVIGLLSRPPAKAERGTHTQPTAGSLRPLLSVYLVTIGIFAVVCMVLVQGSLLMSGNGIHSPAIQSMVITASTSAFAVTATASSWIETHLRKWTFTAALTSLAAGSLIMGSIPTVWAAVLGSMLLGAGSGLSSPYLVKAVIERASADTRDRAVALIAPTHNLGQFANPLVMHPLRVMVGLNIAFIFVGFLLAAGAVWTLLRRLRGQSAI